MHAIDLLCNVVLISGERENMFQCCIMKWKWTNSNIATSPIIDDRLFSTVCLTW